MTALVSLVASLVTPAVSAILADNRMEGERRVWAHIAMDRITGKVIDIEREQVNE